MTNAPLISRHDDADVLVGDVASALLDRLEAAQARGEVPQVGLTGGTIAEELHRELARRAVDSAVDWSRVVFWWGDERFVPADSPDRNARKARESLLDHVPVDPANVHEVPASDQVATAEDAAAAYGEALREHGAGFFEVLMLGIGPDGHCASLFPGHAALEARDAIAVAVHDSPKPPPDRVSLTFECFDRSHEVWFLVAGRDKAESVAAALSPGADRWDVPAAGPRGSEATLWLLDTDAASAIG